MIQILHADDDVAVFQMMEVLFERDGPDMVVESVKTGAACLERMKRGGVDVLLLDLNLPDIDGLTLLSELAISGDSTPVVMVSGAGQTELAVRALRTGASDCVDKGSPQLLEVVDIVRRLHARRQAEPAKRRPREEPGRRHKVVLIEGTEWLCKEIGNSFAQIGQTIDFQRLKSASQLGPDVIKSDAVLIGPRPGDGPLDLLRRIRSQSADLPVILIFQQNDADAAVAAFKLGAQDYILENPNYITELNFSLTHVLNRTALTRHNAQLSQELEMMNRSLEALVAARTSELEALSLRFISVREDERRAIARELHDDIGQLLTGLKMQLEAAAGDARPQVAEQLREALEGVTRLLERTRALTLRLRPLVLDDLGLQPAIEWHLKLFQKQTEIAVESEFSLPAERLSDELETTIFRIVQESLTNVARHSGSTTAHVMITAESRHIVAEIADRGCGFDIDTVRALQNSLGLVGLAERARLVGGSLEIITLPGRGTRVHARFPLRLASKIQ